ncbi:MAG: SPOR domain-containing protein [Sphingomonas sp.]|uniref:SPOR domain-containing protein n=1 Tax=Sphingomonas sp. TaxID=28214 RepID=UPI002274226D|nr:SPOR domain-containing protein [Sphingomonas sp.]MCX8477281.1 SPOR domain-containing protein [Sphingomonas sp.]
MKQIRFLHPIALALLLAMGALPVRAQTGMIQQINPDADRLAQEMRVLAADPRNVRALLEAGALSARLGDTAASLAFFARAEAIDPTNPRIFAGRGAALVRMERPGEALRLFQTAEARGLLVREYAADRGLAYDLLGQPLLAQADYKLALQAGYEDETVRRYALSLGITGNVEEAMRLLDPLLRKTDRAAWRARAFVLAMNGDVAGAERIAGSMMPGNMGSSLAPFFRRLANLGPADRAFAVHFGQISPTAARLADARLAPPLPRYVPPGRPVQLAQAQPQPQPARAPIVGNASREASRQPRRGQERGLLPAARVTAPVQTATAAPLPGPPVVPRQEAPIVQPLPVPRAEEIDAPVRDVAAVQPAQPETPAVGQTERATVSANDSVPNSAPQPAASTPAPAPAPTGLAATPERPPVEALPASARPAAGGPEAPVAAARSEPAPPGPARVGQEDSVLAAIVRGITIPAEELQVVTAVPIDPVPEPVRIAAAAPETARPVPKPEAAKPPPPKPVAKAKPETAKPDPKAKKPDPKAKDPARAEPARVWVQVAGGANVASLPKAWKAVVAKAPAAFRGKSGWWTPLRATNRVLAGPFKTAAEAQAFVNALRKSDVSGFVFTSEAGQKVTKLAAD